MKVYGVIVNNKTIKLFLHKSKAEQYRFKLFQDSERQLESDFKIKTFTVNMEV